MKSINKVISGVHTLPHNDIDTDQIIPARFLKEVNRETYANTLMADWRNNKNHWLNKPNLNKILVAGSNFGCGSSREHAAWAIKDFGFDVILAKSFADIFKNNALNNGIIPIELPPSIVDIILKNSDTVEVNIELESQRIEIKNLYKGSFEIETFKKECILNGNDEVDFLVSLKPEIKAFETNKKY